MSSRRLAKAASRLCTPETWHTHVCSPRVPRAAALTTAKRVVASSAKAALPAPYDADVTMMREVTEKSARHDPRTDGARSN